MGNHPVYIPPGLPCLDMLLRINSINSVSRSGGKLERRGKTVALRRSTPTPADKPIPTDGQNLWQFKHFLQGQEGRAPPLQYARKLLLNI
eukprot:1090182-Amphidinium_carterae.1